MPFSNMRRSLALFTALLAFTAAAGANDSAASKSSGGILLTREARISIEKERLTASEKKITVEYEFLNDTDEDITTEVAFPVPPYNQDEDYTAAGLRMFDEFHLWVDGKPEKFETESKALYKDKDYTALLNKLGVDVASLGHYEDGTVEADFGDGKTGNMAVHFVHDFDKLSSSSKAQLTRLGLIGVEDTPPKGLPHDTRPNWTVHKTYHWQQTFPAHKTLHVRHTYEPAVGFAYLSPSLFDPGERKKEMKEAKPVDAQFPDYREITRSCIEPSLQKSILSKVTNGGTTPVSEAPGDAVPAGWVDTSSLLQTPGRPRSRALS